MQLTHIISAGALITAFSLLPHNNKPAAATSNLASSEPGLTASGAGDASTPKNLSAPPVANGHYVLVVEGDRNSLAVTFASKKSSPWAGAPKAFQSNWRVSVLDVQGQELANVPLDVRPFATDARSVGKPLHVNGCVVVDSKIGMLVNVPAFANAASYTFSRQDAAGIKVALGTTTGFKVRDLAGEGR